MKRIVLLLLLVLSAISFSANRTVSLPGIWASVAETTIPETPIKGTTYRNTDFGSTEIAAGWAFDTIVVSEHYNQAQYIITSIIQQLEQQGILSWCSTTSYSTGSLAMGSDGAIYIALQNSTNKDPVNEATYWRVYLQLSNLYNGTSEVKATTEKALKDGLATKVSSVTGTSPIVSSGGITPAISINDASTSAKGAVRLSNLYNGTSEVKATTEKALSDGLAANLPQYDGTVIVDNTTVPTTWTTLDLPELSSNLKGKANNKRLLVYLKAKATNGYFDTVAFRTNGDTEEVGYSNIGYDAGISILRISLNYIGYALVLTDQDGCIQWKNKGAAAKGTLTIMSFQVVN